MTVYTDIRSIPVSRIINTPRQDDGKRHLINLRTGEITHGVPSEAQVADRERSDRISLERIELFHALWREIHAVELPTKEWFDDWVSRVPSSGCGCQSWLKDHLATNPPRFDDLHRFGWELHNAVNAKLSKPEFSWDEFEEKYPLE